MLVNIVRTNIRRYILKVPNYLPKYPSLYSPESMGTELLHTEKNVTCSCVLHRTWARPILRWPYGHYENIRSVEQCCPLWNMGAISTFLVYFATLHQLFMSKFNWKKTTQEVARPLFKELLKKRASIDWENRGKISPSCRLLDRNTNQRLLQPWPRHWMRY
jgi:hypothetical protein